AAARAGGDDARPVVLVVDDFPLSRRLLARVLEPAGFQVVEAGTIAEAERTLATATPAAIVVDLNLPDGDGLELVSHCRDRRRTAACAIVACSASDRGDETAAAIRAGADAYVLKPVDTRRFAALIAELVARRRSGAASAPQPLEPCSPA
ncbi:MAG: response regulator, partial [Solirubrobacteraceae bacterium]